MEESLEERLARLELQNVRTRSKRWLILAILAVFFLFCGAAFYVISHRGEVGLRTLSALNLDYTPYYPKEQVGGYEFQASSLTNQVGIVTYTLKDQGRTITITQQSAPPNPPSLDQLSGFKKLEVVTGSAVIGTERGRTLAVINTANTIISLTGSSTAPKADVADVAASLRPIR